MAFLSSLVYAAFFWLSFALNIALLFLQIFRVPAANRPTSKTLFYRFLIAFGFSIAFNYFLLRLFGVIAGWYLQNRSSSRREKIVSWVESNDPTATTADKEEELQPDGKPKPSNEGAWNGIIGFFHPFCNAGGGGERVLWAAIKTTQEKYPKATCVVYTGDHDATKLEILERVKTRFNIELQISRVFFLYLSQRRFVLAATWPRFTLLGQSLGSVILGVDAFSLLVPDIFIDTMGYAYTLALARFLFPNMPVGAYVHYPTISTDMLGSLDAEEGRGLNAGSGKGVKGFLKKTYWRLFAASYSWVGGHVDVVMTNSSWTQSHIKSLWGESRESREKKSKIEVVFPPVAVEELEEAIDVSAETEAKRENILVYIAQFRPEKNHTMILRAFAEMRHSVTDSSKDISAARLVLIGSVRDSDDAKRVYELRLLAHELKIKEQVEFICDASWPDILGWLAKSSIGVNGMWNEHFGIGVVEYQAAGLISVVNNSGGPKQDIVIDHDGGSTGFHASNPTEYAEAFAKALTLSPEEKLAMRLRARSSAKRFGDQEFADDWIAQVETLVALDTAPAEPDYPEFGICAMAAAYASFIGYEIWKILR